MNAEFDHTKSPLRHATDENFWRSLNPDLHITSFPLSDSALYSAPDGPLIDQYRSRMLKEGYFHTAPIITRAKAERLSRVVADLVHRKIAPVFAFVYDEFWQLFATLDPVSRSLLGNDYKMMPTDIWVWHVPKGPSASGWMPHRDLPSKDTVRNDNSPRVMNLWIPLTDATPLNACMYVLPTNLDPNVPNKLEDHNGYALHSFQNIRAVPAVAGSAIGWNTHILHWGGRSSEWADQPRISVALYLHSQDCQLQEIENDSAREGFTALMFDKSFEMPFQTRLRAITGAIVLYSASLRNDLPDMYDDLIVFVKGHFRRSA